MEPRVQYVKTADGIDIAYWSLGSGTPIVDAGQQPTHCEMEWRLAPIRRWYERFIAHHQFVRFDTRGCGLSTREIDEYSLETIVRDLEAVTDALSLERFALMGAINSSAASILYAARHPERVSHLILWCPYSRGSEFFDDPGTRALRDLVDRDWHMMSETATRSRFSWSSDEHAREYAALWRAAVTPRVLGMLMDTLAPIDVGDALPLVQAPTLVLQRQDRGANVARRIVDGMPNAKVMLLPGGSAAPYLDDADDVWAAIAEFIGDEPFPAHNAATTTTAGSGMCVVLFTDIADSTALTERLGDAAFREKARALDGPLRTAVREHGGAVIDAKTLGDGILATFPAASQAIAAALACARAGEDAGLPLHLGLHAGDVIRESDNVFGGAVNIAARISALAPPGEVLVSATVRDLGRTSAGVVFEDRGEHALKGIAEPQRVYAVLQQTT